MKKIISLLMMIAMCVVPVLQGCGGGKSNPDVDESKATIIRAVNFDGGVGTQWLKDAAKRFEAKVADKTYEDGKKGVYIEIAPNQGLSTGTMNTSGYNMYFDEANSDVRVLSQKDFLLDITDIVTAKDEDRNGVKISIEDKIDVNQRAQCKGVDGKYYGLPHYQWHPGAVYDRETFNEYNLYFADSSETNVVNYNSKFGNACFVKNKDGKKSCGSDGEFGTQDDGLPASLEEMIILCAYMQKNRIVPLSVSGQYKHMTNYLVEGLWASLAGFDEMRSVYDFVGDIEVVTGFTNENLFQGINYIKKPIVETKTITKENVETEGRLIYDSVARYYAASFIEIMYREGWLSKDATTDTVSATGAQNSFIFSGFNNKEKIGILIEGSYWYNESIKNENFKDYFNATSKEVRDVRFMPLPTSVNQTGQVGERREVTYIDSGLSYGFINNNIKNKSGLVSACKDFLKFLYTDKELRAMAVNCGTKRALKFDLTEEDYSKMAPYQRDMLKLVDNGKVIYACADNATFLSGAAAFQLNMFSQVFRPKVGTTDYSDYFSSVLAGKHTVENFESTKMTPEKWSALYVPEEA